MSRLSREIGQRLRDARAAAGLSQEEVARRAGVSHQHIYRLEKAKIENPRKADLERVAAVFDLTADDLMGLDDREASPADDGPTTYADLVRQAQKATGSRKVAIGFARAITNWNDFSEAERKLLEAALEVLADAPEGAEDISKTEF